MVRLATRGLAGSAGLLGLLVSSVEAVGTTVQLDYSTYVGTEIDSTGVTQWLGIRYAAPPVGDLRFAPPQNPVVNDTVQIADEHGPYCLATNGSPDTTATSEDCLFLDVYAPTNPAASSYTSSASNSSSSSTNSSSSSTASSSGLLPVYLFIQGGGFNVNSNPNYNGTGLITASNHSILVVTFNYRVGPYGFLTDANNLITPNNGLLDQRKAMAWVQSYIHLFGGDPNHVVLGGDSAGAASVSLHLTAYGGRDDGLFHAAAAESVSFAAVRTVADSQYQYDNLALRLGCVGNATASLACLRSKTSYEIQQVNYNIPFPGAAAPPLYMYNPVIDGDLIRTVTYTAYAEGNFIRNLPVIFGDDTNGGTIFTPSNTTTLAQSNMFLKNQFPLLTLSDFAEINELYPNPNETACPDEGCYWRQVSNVYGEARYMCPSLYIAAAFAQRSGAPSYAYLWNVSDPTEAAEGYGVEHTVEINAIWGPENTNGAAPGELLPGGVNADAVPVAQGYWTSFIRSFDPNTYRYPGAAEWVAWSGASEERLVVETGGVTGMQAFKRLRFADEMRFLGEHWAGHCAVKGSRCPGWVGCEA